MLTTARSICKVGEEKSLDKDNKHRPVTTVCPELCLMEPNCKNLILSKFDIDLFVLDEESTTTTTTFRASAEPESLKEGEERAEHERLQPLKILKFHERRDTCCTSNSIVISFIKPLLRLSHECAFLVISPKSDYCHNIPHIFAATFNHAAGVDQKIVSHNHQVVYKIPLKDIESLLVTITDLGIANVGGFKKIGENLDIILESDIFSHGPLVTCVPDFNKKYCVPESYKLPSNTLIRLAAIHKDLKESVRHPTVPKFEINKMSIAAFINEIRCMFNCPRQVEKCEQSFCEKTVNEYCVFVTSCVKAIAYCEEKAVDECSFVKPNHCPSENRYACASYGINTFASKCGALANVEVNAEIKGLFNNICPALEFIQESECIKLMPIDEDMIESSCSSSSEDMNAKKEKVVKKKPAVKVQTTTSVSTYGWYVAGGVVAVSVAVAVYVFAL